MQKRIFRIVGNIVDRKTKKGIGGLRVEAWDKDLLCNDLVGSAETDVAGSFRIEFDQGYFQELFFDRLPDLYFRIFHAGTLIHSTEESVVVEREGW
jgi:hypothetical protein